MSLINFVANGTVTVNAQPNITNVGILTTLTVNGNSNLGNVGNVHITGGSANYVLTTDGTGNLNWTAGNAIANAGTVTNVNTSGSGLGFSLTGGPITTTGTVTLTVPNATSLRSSLNIGNIANLNLNGNGAEVLAGNGAWIPSSSYSNSNVANYLPNYTGNLSAGNANIIYTISANNANVLANITSGNANLGNAVIGNFFLGNGYNLSYLNAANVIGVVANANYAAYANQANIANIAGTVTVNAQPNITSVGNLTSLNVVGNTTSGNFVGIFANGNSNVSIPAANGNVNISVAGNSNVLTITGTGINVSNYGNFIGNVTAGNMDGGNLIVSLYYQGTLTSAAQPNITSVGNLTGLTVNGAMNVSGNVSFTGSNVTLGTVGNLHINGGNNGQFLQTDGTGNLVWSAASSGNGTVGGSNTQIQYNNAGNFGGTVGFTFDSATSNVNMPGNLIVADNVYADNFYGNLSGNLGSNTSVLTAAIFRNTTQIVNVGSNFSNGGSNVVNFNLLSGSKIINLDGFDRTANSNLTITKDVIFNLIGNGNVTLANTISVGESMSFGITQRAAWTTTTMGGPREYVWTLLPTFQIDGTNITTEGISGANTTSQVTGGGRLSGNISTSSSNVTLYQYDSYIGQITKIDSTPTWLIELYDQS
jgi:hypothetical protein